LELGYMGVENVGAMIMSKPAPDVMVWGFILTGPDTYTDDFKTLGLDVVGSVNYTGTGADLMNALLAGASTAQ
ncbi:MAG TPA: hypothetical protein VHP83_26200, partial [Aggregatilineaceae bacterium]|nr:hypothetical protein [Aggregatilineaceae bacterium]